MPHIEKLCIIGSGPAGFTAAIYAARALLSPILFKGSAPNLPGGQLMMTSEVENYPGFIDGLLGPELMERMEGQAQRFGAIMKDENITSVDFSKRPFKLVSESGEVYFTQTVIIATGANAKLLGIDQEKELMGRGAGVSACATCDGAFYKNMNVAVVGGGDSAMEEALFLTRFASKVAIIHRSEAFRASKIMLDRAKSNTKISFELNKTVEKLHTDSEGFLSGLSLKDTKSGQIIPYDCQGLFVAIGHQPSSDLFKTFLEFDSKSYIKTVPGSSKTNIPGVFACGDVQDSIYRQAVTAAGSGCMAAIDAERFLAEGH